MEPRNSAKARTKKLYLAAAEAEAYCRQPAATLTTGIGPRWDPWPYICSMSRPLFFWSFR
jgi:hypothetical protein